MFDEQPVLAATVDHLNRHRLEAFFGRSPTIPWLDLLRNTRVTHRDEGGVDRPTVAGLLTFGTEPTEFLASGSIEAACYSGERLSSDDLVHAERLAGRAPDQIDAAVAFAAQFMRHPTPARPAGNSDPPYDLDVVDEAIVNAVAHRDYAISGSKIRLFLFADRLEIYSPGGLPNTITLDEMPYRTFTRNQLLVSFLSRIRSKRHRPGVPRIARRRRAEDPPERRGAFRPAARVRAVRRRAPADLVGEERASNRLMSRTSQGLNHAVNTMPPTRRAMLRADAGNHASSRPAPSLDCAERACTPRRPAALASMPMG